MLVCLRTKNTTQFSSCWKASSTSAVSPSRIVTYLCTNTRLPPCIDLDQQAIASMEPDATHPHTTLSPAPQEFKRKSRTCRADLCPNGQPEPHEILAASLIRKGARLRTVWLRTVWARNCLDSTSSQQIMMERAQRHINWPWLQIVSCRTILLSRTIGSCHSFRPPTSIHSLTYSQSFKHYDPDTYIPSHSSMGLRSSSTCYPHSVPHCQPSDSG
jgi:hypothetical protein